MEEHDQEPVEDVPEVPEPEEPSQGKAARETLDDWSFLVNALKLNRQV